MFDFAWLIRSFHFKTSIYIACIIVCECVRACQTNVDIRDENVKTLVIEKGLKTTENIGMEN